MFKEHKKNFSAYCKRFEKDKPGVVFEKDFLKCFQLCQIKIEQNLERFILLKGYSTTCELNLINYSKFLDFFSEFTELDIGKMVNYYISKISSKLTKLNLPIKEVFKVENDTIAGKDFLEGLSKLGLEDISPTNLSSLLEFLQSQNSSDLCIDFSILQEKLFPNKEFLLKPEIKESFLYEFSSDSQPFYEKSQHLSENSIFTLSP